jgi:hypothetical protein
MLKKKLLDTILFSFILGYNFEHYKYKYNYNYNYKISFKSKY